ncbi:MAG: taurine catabolism dioxygenase TauD [Hydrocarboniphaga sp.]|uniref:TauD/TfdA dioxygenase family protein n=1 Tax=Hydrocarboniphaga sp. TaxID=2033016 RepID=UPI00262A6572|nr:TauD/TfdA family dioxygenase [Hydrocarboniphaga sp.]MDB5970384.1 taurine catabolism dioxygenase TauD [Hydrocarboniphaga sp.]
MTLKVEPIKPAIGAVVHLDRSQITDAAIAKQCMELVDKHGVIVFPKLGLTDEEQIAFTEKLGARVNFTTSAPGGDKGGLYTISLDPKLNSEPEYVLGTFFYHMDGLAMEGIPPPKASVLACRRTAPKGGQTEFASTYAAYEALSAEDKAEFENLRVVHSVVAGVREVADAVDIEPRKRARKAERPLVWTHKCGRKSLLIGYTADSVVGMSKAEGRALLIRLLEWAGQPAFSYRHYWSVGDLVVWDNCGALHRVIPYATDSGRMMNRTSVAGVEMLA